jgi:hypothetical protein
VSSLVQARLGKTSLGTDLIDVMCLALGASNVSLCINNK